MSRHCIPVREPDKYWGVVGYDNPLETFFGIIELICEMDRDPVVIWIGASTRIETVDALESAIAEYASIPPEIKEQLQRDKANARPPSLFQRQTIARFTVFRDDPAQDQ